MSNDVYEVPEMRWLAFVLEAAVGLILALVSPKASDVPLYLRILLTIFTLVVICVVWTAAYWYFKYYVFFDAYP